MSGLPEGWCEADLVRELEIQRPRLGPGSRVALALYAQGIGFRFGNPLIRGRHVYGDEDVSPGFDATEVARRLIACLP